MIIEPFPHPTSHDGVMPSAFSGGQLGRYELTRLIGRGGMGEVYEARDPHLKRSVAIKVLKLDLVDEPARRGRFEREALATASLAHPNIVSVYDYGVHDGVVFLVTEFVPGVSLRSHLSGRRVPLKVALNWAGQIAAGLGAAHEMGIIHRDLTPENILVTPTNRIKILDFGIAKLTNTFASRVPDLSTIQETDPGVLLGTIRYMAPERLRGRALGTASDVFSVGLILHELITGVPFFGQSDLGDVVAALGTYRKYTPPHVKNPDARRFLRIVARCLARDPLLRPSGADLETVIRRLSPASRVPSRGAPKRVRGGKHETVSSEARKAWSKARFLLNAQLQNWCAESFAALQTALDLEPDFIDARIDLSRWYAVAAVRGEIPYETGLLQAVREAEFALMLDPASTYALGALARAHYVARRFSEAEGIFQQILDRSPEDVSALSSYSELLSLVGRHEAAIEMVTRAIRQDPLNVTVLCRNANALFCSRRFDECVSACVQALLLSPTAAELHYHAGSSLLLLGKNEEAAVHLSRAMELEPKTAASRAALAIACHRLGKQSECAQLLCELEAQHVDPAVRAEAYAGVGRDEEALDCLEQAFRRDSPHVNGILVNALLDPVRTHPRFERLVGAVALPASSQA